MVGYRKELFQDRGNGGAGHLLLLELLCGVFVTTVGSYRPSVGGGLLTTAFTCMSSACLYQGADRNTECTELAAFVCMSGHLPRDGT